MSQSLENLIQSISTKNIQQFFHRKVSSYRAEIEEFDYLLEDDKFDQFSDLQKLGEAELDGSDELLVFSCRYNGELSARSAKKKQYEIAKNVLKEDFKDGAIFVFYDESGKFRFSFIKKNYGEIDGRYSNWKRYTYFVDPVKNNKTFRKRVSTCSFESLEVILEAFSVEPLSKQFYKELSYWYFWSLTQIEFPNDSNENSYVLHANAMIRLITRLMFVWFMKQKKLVPDDLFNKEKLDDLLNFDDASGSTYYKAILQNLFFATLNTPREIGRKFVNRQYGVQNFYRYKRFIKDEDRFLNLMDQIPFLNGGLFENLDIIKPEENVAIRIDCFSDKNRYESQLKVPDYLFFGTARADISNYFESGNYKNIEVTGLIDLLNQYDFTIDENTPYDQEVALDPELLGMVFENLLASYNPETESTARKESGSFYTPRPIVDYMVEESLVHYISDQTSYPKDDLRLLFKSNDKQPFVQEKDCQTIIRTISNLKIIDPACGSGAFPMGALQKMVHALNKLDPDNELWLETQKKMAIEDTKAAFELGKSEDRKQRLIIIEEIFDKGLNDPDYARKLFLIENCLYGVDIQPIAMQISKLRFFISLLVEQNISKEKENFGIIALPNLETKFVAANTLVTLKKPVSGRKGQTNTLFIKNIIVDEKETELAIVRHKYFSARTSKTKQKYRKKDKTLRAEIADILENDGWNTDEAYKIANWDPFDQNAKSNWFDREWMFGVDHFDIVIGNPPYIQLQKALPGGNGDKYADVYKDQNYATFERTGDIYSLFYEKGMNMLHAAGALCYITSNKWMRAKYGKSLRKYFSGKNPLQLIDLGPGVFEAATVDVNILLIQNQKNQSQQLLSMTLKDKGKINHVTDADFTVMDDLSDESWIILSPKEMAIKKKIERIGKPLKEWDVNINYGIKTGYNEAFIIDGQLKDQLIEADPKSAEIIKPILRGKDIKRYKAVFADKWLIATFPARNINIEKYPAIKKYLLGIRPKLEQNGVLLSTEEKVSMKKHGEYYGLDLRFKEKEKSRKRTSNMWFETQDQIGYYREFEKEKMIYPNMTKYLPFIYDLNNNYLINDKAFILTGSNIKYFIGYFNSIVGHYLVKKNCPELQGGTRELRKVFMKNIFIPISSSTLRKKIERCVDIILSKKVKNQSTRDIEHQIDLMISKLYDLTYDEVLIVDPNTPISRDEYEKFTL